MNKSLLLLLVTVFAGPGCGTPSGPAIYTHGSIPTGGADIPGAVAVYLEGGTFRVGSQVTLLISLSQEKTTVQKVFGIFEHGDLGRAAVSEIAVQAGDRKTSLFSRERPWGNRLVGKYAASHDEKVALTIPASIGDLSGARFSIHYFLARVGGLGFYNDTGTISFSLSGQPPPATRP